METLGFAAYEIEGDTAGGSRDSDREARPPRSTLDSPAEHGEGMTKERRGSLMTSFVWKARSLGWEVSTDAVTKRAGALTSSTTAGARTEHKDDRVDTLIVIASFFAIARLTTSHDDDSALLDIFISHDDNEAATSYLRDRRPASAHSNLHTRRCLVRRCDRTRQNPRTAPRRQSHCSVSDWLGAR